VVTICLTTMLKPGVLPDMAALRAGAEVNRDGYGFAVWTATGYLTGRGLDGPETLAEFEVARRSNPRGPALFWSRWATAGAISEANCQPLPVDLADGRGVMAHNGTIPHLADGERSDSHVLAETLPRNPHHPHIRQMLGDWLATHESKVVLLTAPGEGLVFGDGYWQGGAWHSNSDFHPPLEGGSLRGQVVPGDHKERRLLYRKWGDMHLAGNVIAGALRGALLRRYPELGSGREQGND
jgi:hypothetical protein